MKPKHPGAGAGAEAYLQFEKDVNAWMDQVEQRLMSIEPLNKDYHVQVPVDTWLICIEDGQACLLLANCVYDSRYYRPAWKEY